MEKQDRNVSSQNLMEQSPKAVKYLYCKPALSLVRVDPKKKTASEVKTLQADDLEELRKRWVYRIKGEIDRGVYDIDGKLDEVVERLIVSLG